jgi:Astacin (Peptidase family M12A)
MATDSRRRGNTGSGGTSDGGNGGDGNGATGTEQHSSPEVRTALISGRTFGIKAVQYAVVDGLAIFEGDIILGTVEEVEQQTAALRDVESGAVAMGVAISSGTSDGAKHWPKCVVPFTIDPALTNQARVTDAIAHWQAKTNYKFVARTTEVDFVTFRPAGASGDCSSTVGRKGGQQFVLLGLDCSKGNAIHEIGHTIGLWHEQSREDRDSFVQIHWDKIKTGFEHNFDQHIVDGDDIGPYDYGSIMHYPRVAFAKDNVSETITPLTAGAQIGQRLALSAGDIAAANSLCTAATVKAPLGDITKKEAVKDLVLDTKKESVIDTLKEMPSDTKKEAVFDPTIKEGVFDPTIKETAFDPTIKEGVFDPTIKEGTLDPTLKEGSFDPTIKEGVFDPKGFDPKGFDPKGFDPKGFDPKGFDPRGPGGGIPRTGGAVPFAVATPHQAPGATADANQPSPADAAAQLDQQLQMVAEALQQLEAQRQSLQKHYEELAALLQQAVQQHDQETGG